MKKILILSSFIMMAFSLQSCAVDISFGKSSCSKSDCSKSSCSKDASSCEKDCSKGKGCCKNKDKEKPAETTTNE